MSSTHLSIIDRSYRLHEPLGQGGMGTVYRASELVSGKAVALKLVSHLNAQLPRPSVSQDLNYRLALTREFQTLASLHHPHVIRVLSYGFDEEHGSYYTMELLDRPQTLLEATTGQSIAVIAKLLAQLLRALAYIHQRGIVHRDIKPSNVLVVDGEVKLLDFGIAVEAAGEATLAGTVEYLAPELLLGEPPSISSDLYSVGVLAYQILTGHFPYGRDSMTQMLQGILGTNSDLTLPPTAMQLVMRFQTPPSDAISTADLAGEGSEQIATEQEGSYKWRTMPALALGPLGEVVRRLVSKLPKERYPNAAGVLQDVAAAMGMELPIETVATRESFLQATRLVGRDAELGLFQGALTDAAARRGRGFLLGGESGVGKSRLISELRTHALVHGFWVAEGQSATEQQSYYQEWLPLLQALGFRTELGDGELSILQDVLPGLGKLLGREVPRAPKGSPQEVQDRIVGSLVALLRRTAKPLLLILEDLHWVKSESLNLLVQLSQQMEGLPLMLIGTYRSDERPDLPRNLPSLQPVSLNRLGDLEIAQLSSSILGPVGKQPALVRYLAGQTEGNIFFLIEIMRALAERSGELTQIGRGELPDSILTSGIERIVERRIERLPSAFHPMLDFAAILGRKLDLKVLEHAFPQIQLRDFLIECANAAVLESLGSDWRFSHDKVRETISHKLDGERRKHLHLTVANSIEAVHEGAARDSLSAMLAIHFQQAGYNDKALHYYLQAGDNASSINLREQARSHYAEASAVLKQLPASTDRQRLRVDLLLKQVQVGLLSDAAQTQHERLNEARALLEALMSSDKTISSDRLRMAWIDYYCGRVYFYSGQPRAALPYYQRVLPIAKEFQEQELIVLPSALISQALVTQGRLHKAHELLEQIAEPMLKLLGVTLESIRCLIYHCVALAGTGHCQQALAGLERAKDLAKPLTQPYQQANILMVQGPLFIFMADWPMALRMTEELLELCTHASEAIFQYASFDCMAWAQSHLGDHGQAIENRNRAKEIRRTIGGGGPIADWFEAAEAEILFNAGRTEDALRQAQIVAQSSRAAGLSFSAAIAERVWGCALARLGSKLREAEEHFAASLEICRADEIVLVGAQTELGWGTVCHERGELEAARAHFSTAVQAMEAGGYEYALAQARRIISTLQ